MKTEQELKDALEDVFFDALTDKSNYTDKVDPENDGCWQYTVYELCADELIKRGYGDVSEYKAEIERLKKENAYLLKACDKQFTFDTTENKKYSIFNSVRKEFADKIKVLIFQKYNPYAVPFEEFVNANALCIYIDELLKEYEK